MRRASARRPRGNSYRAAGRAKTVGTVFPHPQLWATAPVPARGDRQIITLACGERADQSVGGGVAPLIITEGGIIRCSALLESNN